MNTAVEILLERMKTHPEEFTDDYKWATIMQDLHKYATKEESQALDTGLRALMMEKLTGKVMEQLIDPKPEEDDNMGKWFTKQAVGTPLGGTTAVGSSGLTLTVPNGGTGIQWANTTATTATLNANSLTLGQQTIDEKTIEHMKAHLDWMKREKQLKEQAKQKTLYGRLKNYLGADA